MKRTFALLVPVALAVGVTWAVGGPPPAVHFREVVKRTPIDPRTGGALTPVLQGEHATVNVWQLTAKIPAHFHREHEEIVIVQEGEGDVRLGAETRRLKAGDVLLIPTNVVHEVIARGNRPFRGISVFSPQFDGKDRVLVQP